MKKILKFKKSKLSPLFLRKKKKNGKNNFFKLSQNSKKKCKLQLITWNKKIQS